MENMHFIHSVSVKNFKQFENKFEVTDLSQFNIITGENNVGKTTLLDAILVNEENIEKSSINLLNLLKLKNFSNKFGKPHLNYFANNENKEIEIILKYYNLNETHYKFIPKNENWMGRMEKYIIGKNKPQISENEWLGKDNTNNLTNRDTIPYIGLQSYSNIIAYLYENKIVDCGKKDYFIETINKYFEKSKILNFEPRSGDPLFVTVVHENDKRILLLLEGDGFIKFFRTLIEIVSNQDKFVLIDEVDTGLHFTKQVKFWEMVLNVSIELNVQIFATTHSDESLKAFVKSFENLKINSEKARLIKMNKTIDNSKVYVNILDFNTLKFQIENEWEVR